MSLDDIDLDLPGPLEEIDPDEHTSALESASGRPAELEPRHRRGLKWLGLYPYTACFNLGDALNLTVLRVFTLMRSPVRGLRAFPAFILRTVKVPKLGKVNFRSSSAPGLSPALDRWGAGGGGARQLS